MAWAAAGRSRPGFEALDITGAPKGNGFQLLETECRPRAADVTALLHAEAKRAQMALVRLDPERDVSGVLRGCTGAFARGSTRRSPMPSMRRLDCAWPSSTHRRRLRSPAT